MTWYIPCHKYRGRHGALGQGRAAGVRGRSGRECGSSWQHRCACQGSETCHGYQTTKVHYLDAFLYISDVEGNKKKLTDRIPQPQRVQTPVLEAAVTAVSPPTSPSGWEPGAIQSADWFITGVKGVSSKGAKSRGAFFSKAEGSSPALLPRRLGWKLYSAMVGVLSKCRRCGQWSAHKQRWVCLFVC